MSSQHHSHFSYTFKTKGKNKFQSYNTEEGKYGINSVNKLYNKISYKKDEKRQYPRQLVKSPNSSYRRRTPSNQRNPEPKGKKMKSIQKLFQHTPTFSFKKSQNDSFYSPIKNERSKEKTNHNFFSSFYTNKKKGVKTNQKLTKKFNHNKNQSIGNNNFTFNQKLLSPKKVVVAKTPKRYEDSLKKYSTQSKVFQSQTIKPYSKYSRNAKKPQSPYRNTNSSFDLNNSTTRRPRKCKYCNNYLIEQKVYKRSVPKEEMQIFKTTSNLRSKSGNKSNLKGKVLFSPKKGNIYDTYNEEVGTVETTIKNNRYNPNYYVNEFGTSVFKEPKKTSTLVEHYVKNKNQGNKVRYYNDAKVFGKKNNMVYYEINESPKKKVFTSPFYI